MNPMLFMDFDFSFFTGLFRSKEDEEKEEKKDKEDKEQKNNKKTSKKETTKEKAKEKEKEEKKIEENNENKININKKEEKKEINKIEENTNKNQEKKEINKKDSHKNQKDNEKKLGLNKRDEILKFLVNYIKNVYLYRKQVKKLLQRQKDNYSIISSINSKDLSMEIYLSEDNTQKVKYTYEPILQQNIFYIPKSNFKKKNLLKFSFLNKKKESIIDPKFNTEYDCGEFINVINLKKIKDKEEEKEEDFQTFLESYYTLRQSMSKQSFDKNKLKLETIRVKKRHKTMDSHKKGLVFGGNKLASSSILKQRREHRRVTSNKKISFSDKNETLSYKKDD
jgi:hypothetical protein